MRRAIRGVVAVMAGLGVSLAAVGCSGSEDELDSDSTSVAATSVTATATAATQPTHDSASGVSDGHESTGAGGVGTGTLTIRLRSHASATEGVLTEDGWEVKYSKFLTSGGALRVASDTSLHTPALHDLVIDGLAHDNVPLWTSDLDAGLYNYADLTLRPPSHGDGLPITIWAAKEDVDLMHEEDYALYLAGTLTSPEGTSCDPFQPDACVPAPSVTFRWGVTTSQVFATCADVFVDAGTTSSIDLALAGDTWLLTGLGDKASAGARLAQWIADADLDHDGEATLAELEAIPAAQLFTQERGYDLTPRPGEPPIDTAYDFLVAQVRVMGRYPNGSCEPMPTSR